MKIQNITFLIFFICLTVTGIQASKPDRKTNPVHGMSAQKNKLQKTLHKEKVYDWAVVGAGPAGLIAVGALLDSGVEASKILLIDPDFCAGALLKCGEVVSNTTVQAYLDSFSKLKSFHSDLTEKGLENLRKFPRNEGCSLQHIADSLKTVSDHLRKKVVAAQVSVEQIEQHDDYWKIKTSLGCSCCAHKVILACGSHPKELNFEKDKVIPLYDCFRQDRRSEIFSEDDIVAVFGNAHSAILIMQKLLEQGVQKIINFYRTTLNDSESSKYHYLAEYLTEDLLGWLNTVILRDVPNNLIQVSNTAENCDFYRNEITKVVYAIGFERNFLPIKNRKNEEITCFDNETGVIEKNLFGIGIAYPRVAFNNGQLEDQVSIPEFVNRIHAVLPSWLAS